jgi:hypothetical protein
MQLAEQRQTQTVPGGQYQRSSTIFVSSFIGHAKSDTIYLQPVLSELEQLYSSRKYKRISEVVRANSIVRCLVFLILNSQIYLFFFVFGSLFIFTISFHKDGYILISRINVAVFRP